jgi:hypothetical protein
MDGFYLGKIESVDFGLNDTHTYFGLHLHLKFNGGGCFRSIDYNYYKGCKWKNELEKLRFIEKTMDRIRKLLEDAQVEYVSQLKNKPVEVLIIDNCLYDFRILTEVL